ncbi:MAG: hypothetical protein ABSG36_01480 [Acidimicrobiales bacterium]
MDSATWSEELFVEPPRQAEAIIVTAMRELDGCHKYVLAASGVSMVMGSPVRFPRVGDVSTAVPFRVSVDGVVVSEELLTARFGNIDGSFAYIGASADITSFDRLVGKASAKILDALRRPE